MMIATDKAPMKSKGRSKITNGTSLLVGEVDGRSHWARRFRDLIDLFVSDLGGRDVVTVAERSIIRRVAALEVELERMEARFALDGQASDSDLDLYNRTTGNHRRQIETIGLKRRQKTITLSGHLKAKGFDAQ